MKKELCLENGAVEVIAAKKVSARKGESLLAQIRKMLTQSSNEKVTAGVIAFDNSSLSESVKDLRDDCWLTLSKEIDGITYLDIYQTS